MLDNAHQSANPDIAGAHTVELINFPGADLNLLSMFEENTAWRAYAVAARPPPLNARNRPVPNTSVTTAVVTCRKLSAV
ncbi:MAG TPA: hypothetical protein VF788_17375, partial [Pseudonocardiaceae bacterium]